MGPDILTELFEGSREPSSVEEVLRSHSNLAPGLKLDSASSRAARKATSVRPLVRANTPIGVTVASNPIVISSYQNGSITTMVQLNVTFPLHAYPNGCLEVVNYFDHAEINKRPSSQGFYRDGRSLPLRAVAVRE